MFLLLFVLVCVEAVQRQIGLVRSPFTVMKAAFLWPLHMSLQPASDVFWESAWTYVWSGNVQVYNWRSEKE